MKEEGFAFLFFALYGEVSLEKTGFSLHFFLKEGIMTLCIILETKEGSGKTDAI